MEIWTNAVFEAVEAEWKRNAPPAPSFGPNNPLPLPTREKAAKAAEGRRRGEFSIQKPWYLGMEEERARQSRQPLGLARIRKPAEDEDLVGDDTLSE